MRGRLTYNDREWQRSFRLYASARDMSFGDALRKRALRIGGSLYHAYRRASPTTAEIRSVAKAVGKALLIRPKIRTAGGSAAQKRARETWTRVSFRLWTAAAWVEAMKLAGIAPKTKRPKFAAPPRARGKARLRGNKPFVELENLQPAAGPMDAEHGGLIQQVFDRDGRDMREFVEALEKKRRRAKF